MKKLKEKSILAIIPARGGSKGIPNKNIMDFCGKPLISWTIEQAKLSKYIREVYVTSDDDKILNISANYGAKCIKRPEEIATDISTSEDALLHALLEIEKSEEHNIDLIVFLQATSPIRSPEDIDQSIKIFYSKNADSLFSATILDDFCAWKYDGDTLRSATFDYKNRGRRQEREPYFLENGSIYLFKPEILKKYNNRFGGKIEIFPMVLYKSYEIDKPEDIETCEYYMKKNILEEQ